MCKLYTFLYYKPTDMSVPSQVPNMEWISLSQNGGTNLQLICLK